MRTILHTSPSYNWVESPYTVSYLLLVCYPMMSRCRIGLIIWEEKSSLRPLQNVPSAASLSRFGFGHVRMHTPFALTLSSLHLWYSTKPLPKKRCSFGERTFCKGLFSLMLAVVRLISLTLRCMMSGHTSGCCHRAYWRSPDASHLYELRGRSGVTLCGCFSSVWGCVESR